MKVRCTKAFGTSEPGDELEAPDGSAVDPDHFEAIAAAPGPPAPAAPATWHVPSASDLAPETKEM